LFDEVSKRLVAADRLHRARLLVAWRWHADATISAAENEYTLLNAFLEA
jgi:hypothetical protein